MIKKIKNIIRDLYYRTKIDKKVRLQWLGSEYGGWFVCPDLVKDDSIVYSFGIGDDISFDVGIINKFDCNVRGYDPTPVSLEFLKNAQKGKKFIINEVGLSYYDGLETFFLPQPGNVSCSVVKKDESTESVDLKVMKLSTIMRENNHSSIDLLKMDIEGGEIKVLDNIIEEQINIKQILVEYHPKVLTKSLVNQSVNRLKKYGYKVVSIRHGKEYTFVHVDH
jgi:FkbM family methyltransferase